MKLPEICIHAVLLSSAAAVARATSDAPLVEAIDGSLDHIESLADKASLDNDRNSKPSLRGALPSESRKLGCWTVDENNFYYRGTEDYCGWLRNEWIGGKMEKVSVKNKCNDIAETTWDEVIGDHCQATCRRAEATDEDNFSFFGENDYCGYIRVSLDLGEKQYVVRQCNRKVNEYKGDDEVGDHCESTCYAAGWYPRCSTWSHHH